MLSMLTSTVVLAGLVAASPLAERNPGVTCKSFYSDIADSTKNVDLMSVIGGPYVLSMP